VKVGEVVGKYRVVRQIGEGGMGAVYEVRHELLGQRFALKCLHANLSSNQEMAARVIREAQAAAAIGSQHIVYVIDVGDIEGTPFVVMEYLEGESLEELIRREKRLAPQRAATLMMQVCEALGAAHEKGIVHRDVKPANIFLTVQGSDREWVKVLDFGIAKVQAVSSQSKSLTKTGSTMGTPCYMAPEQLRKTKEVDHRADIYSAGVILYQMLTGSLPFDADSYEELIVEVIMGTPIPLRKILPNADAALEAVVTRAMARDLAARFQSMDELSDALRPFAHPTTVVVAPPRPEPVQPPPTKLVPPAEAARVLPPTVMHQEPAQSQQITLTMEHPEPEPARPFPWKIALVGVLVVGVVAGAVALWPRGVPNDDEEQQTPSVRAPEPTDGAPVPVEASVSGVWRDPTSGLVWQNPPATDLLTWQQAVDYCAGLDLDGHGPGSWRLPTISELRSLIRGCPATETGGECGVTDSCLDRECRNVICLGCSSRGGHGGSGAYWPAGISGSINRYWSSSSYAGDSSLAYYVNFHIGNVYSAGKSGATSVRCVRGGQR
jgi:serine/threonine-protein kinase